MECMTPVIFLLLSRIETDVIINDDLTPAKKKIENRYGKK